MTRSNDRAKKCVGNRLKRKRVKHREGVVFIELERLVHTPWPMPMPLNPTEITFIFSLHLHLQNI
jgi:hypothetical protein